MEKKNKGSKGTVGEGLAEPFKKKGVNYLRRLGKTCFSYLDESVRVYLKDASLEVRFYEYLSMLIRIRFYE